MSTISLNTMSDESFVHHAYVILFKRICSLHEARSSLGKLAHGYSRIQLWRELEKSTNNCGPGTEAGSKLTLKQLLRHDGRIFITESYRVILSRYPDRNGLYSYLSNMRTGTSKLQILASILNSEEAKSNPEIHDLLGLMSLIRHESHPSESPLTYRDLFKLLQSSDKSFLRDSYLTILGREPDPAGLLTYTTESSRDRSRCRVLASLALSTEGRWRPKTLPCRLALMIFRRL